MCKYNSFINRNMLKRAHSSRVSKAFVGKTIYISDYNNSIKIVLFIIVYTVYAVDNRHAF